MANSTKGKNKDGIKTACKHGCGYETDHKGALNLHENKHCKLIFKEGVKKEQKQKKEKEVCCNNQTLELIPTNVEWGYIAVNNYGYKYYCTNCREVFK